MGRVQHLFSSKKQQNFELSEHIQKIYASMSHQLYGIGPGELNSILPLTFFPVG